MNLSKIDLNLFVVFDAIYTEANLTRAGHIIGITQPAVSNALSRLREIFNDQLFVRTAHGMVPTPVAQNVIGSVRQALQLIRRSVQQTDQFVASDSERQYRVSMGDLVEAVILPRLFGKLDEIAPRINITSMPVQRREAAKELASGRLDFVIDAPLNTDPQVKHVSLFEDNYVCVMRSDHPLAKASITNEEYLSLKHVQISSRFDSRTDEIDIALGRQGINRHIALSAQHYLMAPLVVRRSNLAMTVPERFALAYPDLHCVNLPFNDIPTMEVHLYWHESTELDAASHWMRDCIINICQALSANSTML